MLRLEGNEGGFRRKRIPQTTSHANGTCSANKSSLNRTRFSPCRGQGRLFAVLMIALVVFCTLLLQDSGRFLQDNGYIPLRHDVIQTLEYYAPHTTYNKSEGPDYGGIVRHVHHNMSYNEYRQGLMARMDRDSSTNALIEEQWSHDDCRPPSFMASFYPTCNSMHEGDFVAGPDSYQQGHGYSRQAWIVNHTSTAELSVLKMLRLLHVDNLNVRNEIKKEAIIMERLSASPRIMNMYSHCGASTVVEYLPYSIEERLISSNTTVMLSPHAKLQWALEMAESLAELHGHVKGVVVHGDVYVGQWLQESLHGRLVLGDFNLAKILYFSSNKKEYCKTQNGRGGGSNRSPEEINYTWLDEKIDVYSLCNLYYFMLMGHPVDLPETVNVQEQKETMAQYAAVVSAKYENASRPSLTLAKLLPRCWETKSSRRISVFEIAKYLRKAIQNGLNRTVM